MMLALIMDEATAQQLRAATADGDGRLDPRRVALGEHTGRWLLWASVRSAFPGLAGLNALESIDVDPDTLWPEPGPLA